MPTKIQPSSGNVFRDLDFSSAESESLKVRSTLMIELSKLIQARRLTQAEAADVFGVTQPRVSDLVRGKIDRFSIDTMPVPRDGRSCLLIPPSDDAIVVA